MLEIREMRHEDIPEVVEIENALFSDPWSADGFNRSIDAASDIYLVAVEDGKIAGYCGLWGVIDEGQITNVAVAEAFRKRGIAEKMLNKLMTDAKEHRLTQFTLEVRVSNTPAINLYHKLGFVDEGLRRDFYTKPVEDAIIMWKWN